MKAVVAVLLVLGVVSKAQIYEESPHLSLKPGSSDDEKVAVCVCKGRRRLGKSSKGENGRECKTKYVDIDDLQEYLDGGAIEGECPFDVNGDGKVDLDDLIHVGRTIADPLGELQPGDLTGDVNGDGVVNQTDIINTIIALTSLLGEDAMGDINATYFEDPSRFPWEMGPYPDTRRALQQSSSGPSHAQGFLPSRKLQTCGAGSALKYAKGSGPDPPITWDTNNCPYDPNFYDSLSWSQRAHLHIVWADFAVLLAGAYVALPNGAIAYAHFRDGTGTDLALDYQAAIDDDSSISAAVDQEIDDVKRAVKEMFDGQEPSFDFHSTATRDVNCATADWKFAIGGHDIWSTGTATYNSGSCSLSLDFEIKFEDFYNFEPSGRFFGIPNSHNCNFVRAGWATEFYSRNSVTRTESIDLQCCQDTDCGSATEFDCECNLCTTQCPTNQQSGGQGFQSFTVDLFKTNGTISVFYQMYTIPDELNIFYEGATIFSTGGLVSGTRTTAVTYGSPTSTSTVVTVEMNAPNSGTAWIISVTCPP